MATLGTVQLMGMRAVGTAGAGAGSFREARREVQGLTSSLERRVLSVLAARMPRWVGSDHLTALGLLAAMGAGVAYAASREVPGLLHVVNLCLALNWLGDSLDGTLARHRKHERPRYGFYVDHVIDAIGSLCVVFGLAASGLMSPSVAAILLIAYYLAAIHVYLATYTTGTFKISYGPFGGTELRIMLALANLAALRSPAVVVLGCPVLLFDLMGILLSAGMAVVLLIWVPQVAIRLRREETRDWGRSGGGEARS